MTVVASAGSLGEAALDGKDDAMGNLLETDGLTRRCAPMLGASELLRYELLR